ncbi:uncharacterized protein LOC107494829 [Arachis duranensis]|uniref:Uncharacterized protein LOC107494829 n=1 Tax=Arachis duranensis TaxID=130453 RepID=A0A6P4DNN6_ARADU|nr:uncharacterized protein LOC107494829 [Arachis duranensis]XP_025703956.1 protein NYNRIN-like [Arachis hypogaea]
MENVRSHEPLKLYIAVSKNTIVCMLAQDDENGHEQAIYYLSRVLTDIETRYSPIEKFCLSLYYAWKWMLALTEFDLQYVPAKAVKGQVIADFHVDNSKDLNNQRANECQKHGSIQQTPASELHLIIKPWPFRGWVLDLIGLIHSPSSKQHKFILVTIDYFTKWVEAISLIEVGQSEIIDFIEEHIIHQFEIPQTLSTDQGTMFTGQQIKNFAASRSINIITSTPYYAQANGQVEVADKILISLIKKHIRNKPRMWHETLSQVFWAYQNSPRGSTGTSPYKLVYGHDAMLPLEINLNTLRISKQNDLPVDDYWNAMFDELNELDSERILALENMVRQKESIARSYNRRIREKYFNIEELVLKVILPMKKKLKFLGKWSHTWEGHFQVVGSYSGNAYRIKDIDSGKIIDSINGKYLKQYYFWLN